MLDEAAIDGIARALTEAQLELVAAGIRRVRAALPFGGDRGGDRPGRFHRGRRRAPGGARGRGPGRTPRLSSPHRACRGRGVAAGRRAGDGERMSASGRLIVVKVGGGLSATPGALEVVGRALAEAGRRHRLLVVPGGGPFADAVRAFDQREGLSADAAHWMAILAMDQYAHVLVERIPGAVLVEEPGTIGAVLGGTGVAVLAPSRWLRAADVLPHDWDATSDSVGGVRRRGAGCGAAGADQAGRVAPPLSRWMRTSPGCCRSGCRGRRWGGRQVGELETAAGRRRPV